VADVAPEPAAAACRNCGAPAGDAYCPRCGQETAALPPARQFLKDAAGRYVALDGRLWRTLFALFFRPGFLTLEYLGGRRRRYVRPARLFLVLSLVVFATIRFVVGVPQVDDAIVMDPGDVRPAEGPAASPAAPLAGPKPVTPGDVARAAAAEIRADAKAAGPGITVPGFAFRFDDRGQLRVEGPGVVAKALDERVARFNALPRQERFEQAVLGVLRYGPYAMFALLPAFAFLLMAVHRRSRRVPHRPRLYAEHLVFAAHNHAFFFLAVTAAVAVSWAALRNVLVLWCLAYAVWSLRVVYGGSWIALLARSWIVAIAYFVLFVFAMAGLVVAAVLLR
jgi:hypothetical protein